MALLLLWYVLVACEGLVVVVPLFVAPIVVAYGAL